MSEKLENHYDGLVNELGKVHRSFTSRLLNRIGQTNLGYLSRSQLLNLDTLEYRRTIADLCFIHKCPNHDFVVDYKQRKKLVWEIMLKRHTCYL